MLHLFPMPPKKSQPASLTKAESLLFLIAVHLDTAIKYLEANPSDDASWFLNGVEEEVVCHS